VQKVSIGDESLASVKSVSPDEVEIRIHKPGQTQRVYELKDGSRCASWLRRREERRLRWASWLRRQREFAGRPPDGGAFGASLHVHRASFGTCASVCSMCAPQPAQVGLPHAWHRTSRHIVPAPFGARGDSWQGHPTAHCARGIRVSQYPCLIRSSSEETRTASMEESRTIKGVCESLPSTGDETPSRFLPSPSVRGRSAGSGWHRARRGGSWNELSFGDEFVPAKLPHPRTNSPPHESSFRVGAAVLTVPPSDQPLRAR